MNFSEILFLHCLNDRKLYGYLPYSDRLENPIQRVNDFQKEGYVSFSTPEDSLTRVTVPELKKLLTTYQLPTKGTKPILIQTIIENIPIAEYCGLVEAKKKVYLTDKARLLLKEYKYLFWYKENERMLFRISEDDVKILAEKTPANEMISAIQNLNRKRRLNEMSYAAQVHTDMYNESRYHKCIVCGNKESGDYDLCDNCYRKQLSEMQFFHICQLFSYKNQAALQTFAFDMSNSYNEGMPEPAVTDFRNFCYSFGTPGILYYSELKRRADRQIDTPEGSLYGILKRYG